MAGQLLLSVILFLPFSVGIGLNYNELPLCSGQLTDVGFAFITMKTATPMTCHCNFTSPKMRSIDFALKAEVMPRGTLENVCISPIGITNKLAPLRKQECINRITHFTRDPSFCGWHSCVRVFVNVYGSAALRVTTQEDYNFNVNCAIVDTPHKTTEVKPRESSTPRTTVTTTTATPKSEEPSTKPSTTTAASEKSTPTPQQEIPTDAQTIL